MLCIIKEISIQNSKKNKKLLRKLKSLHRNIFYEKLFLPDEDGMIYTILSNKNKILGMCQIIYKNPELYFEKCDNFNLKTPERKSLYLFDFGILSKYRRKGIGTLFLQAIFDYVREKKCDTINLHIQNGYKNSKLIEITHIILFYTKSGFELLSGEWIHPDESRRYIRMIKKF